MNYVQRQLRRLQNYVRFGARPWMSRAEYQLILDHLTPESTLFEYGSGTSTVFFAPHVRRLFSVEHDEEWYQRVDEHVQKQKRSNVQLHLRRPDGATDGPPNYARSSDARYEQFASYIQNIGAREVDTFDRVLIDGRSRPECAREALDHLHDDSLVFIHDFYNTNYDRDAYHETVFEHYARVASIEEGQSLVVLRPR